MQGPEKEIVKTLRSLDIPQEINPLDLTVEQGNIRLILEAPPSMAPQIPQLQDTITTALNKLSGVTDTQIIFTAHKSTPSVKAELPKQPLLPHVKHIIAVASGKGGVGKSTTSVNLAVCLAKAGLKVGLLDADIYGPSLPKLLGVNGRPDSHEGKILEPIEKLGIKTMSMGYLTAAEAPLIWRGPMVQTAIKQLLGDVNWGELDALIIDMPPGTGDAQLTLAQKVPLSGAIIVTTPQDLSLIDARKGLKMFQKTNTPILGLIENMSLFTCPNCGHESHIFGHNTVQSEAKRLNVPYLGAIPLDIEIRKKSDAGTPPATTAYQAIADQITEALGLASSICKQSP